MSYGPHHAPVVALCFCSLSWLGRFKRFIDEAIFRLRLLDDIHDVTPPIMTPSSRYDAWHDFVLSYLAYHTWIEREPKSLRSRIRHVTVAIGEKVGDTGQAATLGRLKSLCRLAIGHPGWIGHKRPLFQSTPWPWPASDAELEADLCVAAVYLGHQSYIEKLILQGCQFCDWGKTKDVSSRIFGNAYGAATLKGDLSMLRLLISSNPNYPSEPFCNALQCNALTAAAVYGYKDMFEFALDSGALDLVAGEHEDSRRHPDYECLRDAIASTRFPDNYRHGASLFVPHSKVFNEKTRDGKSLLTRLSEKADDGHMEMVQYFLRQEIFPIV